MPESTYDAVDLFAGPGGWDVAARSLGLKVLGIEWDHAACETRRAAGLPTIEGDVRRYGPADFPGVKGFIASPPCQTFSMAGGGAGRRALETVLQLIKSMEAREPIDLAAFDDERTGLVLEPLRWALAAIDASAPFEWLAFEQVPTVLPVWDAMADVLRREGYSVATGKLSSEQYGVPQTRKRAILVARLHGEAVLPAPTHRSYRKGTPQDAGDPALLPWVSMAEALGWTETGLVGFPRRADEGDAIVLDGVAYRERDLRGTAEPSFALTQKARSWHRWEYVSSTLPNAARRSTDDPAPTIAFGHDAASAGFVPAGSDAREAKRAGDARRVEVVEATVLQSFPSDHPWQGSRSAIFQQIGNAVPPLLARAVLEAVTS